MELSRFSLSALFLTAGLAFSGCEPGPSEFVPLDEKPTSVTPTQNISSKAVFRNDGDNYHFSNDQLIEKARFYTGEKNYHDVTYVYDFERLEVAAFAKEPAGMGIDIIQFSQLPAERISNIYDVRNKIAEKLGKDTIEIPTQLSTKVSAKSAEFVEKLVPPPMDIPDLDSLPPLPNEPEGIRYSPARDRIYR